MQHITKAVVHETGFSKFYNADETESDSFVMDKPVFVKGIDLGPAPFGFVASELDSFTSMTLRTFANMKKFSLDEVDTEVTHTPSKDGHHFQRIIKPTGNLTEERRQRLLDITNKGPVHKLLVSDSTVSSELLGEAA